MFKYRLVEVKPSRFNDFIDSVKSFFISLARPFFKYRYINIPIPPNWERDIVNLFGKNVYLGFGQDVDGHSTVEIGQVKKVKTENFKGKLTFVWGSGSYYDNALHNAMTRMMSGLGPEFTK